LHKYRSDLNDAARLGKLVDIVLKKENPDVRTCACVEVGSRAGGEKETTKNIDSIQTE